MREFQRKRWGSNRRVLVGILQEEMKVESSITGHGVGIVRLTGVWQTGPMKTQTPSYGGYWFPSEINSHAIWLYYRFCLGFRKIEKLWIAEVEGRFHKLQEGVVQGISASEVFSELRSKRS